MIVRVWMMALSSGVVLTLGRIALATGRAPFNMLGLAWTPVEDLGASVGRQ